MKWWGARRTGRLIPSSIRFFASDGAFRKMHIVALPTTSLVPSFARRDEHYVHLLIEFSLQWSHPSYYVPVHPARFTPILAVQCTKGTKWWGEEMKWWGARRTVQSADAPSFLHRRCTTVGALQRTHAPKGMHAPLE